MTRGVPIFTGLVAAFAVVLLATPLQADIIWNLDHEYSGATPPEGLFTITLADGSTADTVDIMMDATGLVDAEHVKIVLLNVDPLIDPTALTITESTSPLYSPNIWQGVNAFAAAGDGLFDIEFDFQGSPSGKRPDNTGPIAEFTVAGPSGFNESSFLFESAPRGNPLSLSVAAHIGGIGPDDRDSGWVTDGNGEVPEASTLMLFGSGLIGVLGYLKRKAPFLAGR